MAGHNPEFQIRDFESQARHDFASGDDPGAVFERYKHFCNR
jgi:hypothetical protein